MAHAVPMCNIALGSWRIECGVQGLYVPANLSLIICLLILDDKEMSRA